MQTNLQWHKGQWWPDGVGDPGAVGEEKDYKRPSWHFWGDGDIYDLGYGDGFTSVYVCKDIKLFPLNMCSWALKKKESRFEFDGKSKPKPHNLSAS